MTKIILIILSHTNRHIPEEAGEARLPNLGTAEEKYDGTIVISDSAYATPNLLLILSLPLSPVHF